MPRLRGTPGFLLFIIDADGKAIGKMYVVEAEAREAAAAAQRDGSQAFVIREAWAPIPYPEPKA